MATSVVEYNYNMVIYRNCHIITYKKYHDFALVVVFCGGSCILCFQNGSDIFEKFMVCSIALKALNTLINIA